ncbi:LamG domain-containing protein [Tautonia sociabilis]|nr:LamG domain-containing protein [Tautonia sociabilis]
MPRPRRLAAVAILLPLCCVATRPAPGQEGMPGSMARSLTFAATFDRGLVADLAGGDPALYSSPSSKREDPVAGIAGPGVELLAEGGRSGGALRFSRENSRAHYFRVPGNLPFEAPGGDGWSGSISYFLSLDPETDLPPMSFADPIQVTDSAWNDAAIWNDFTRENPRIFRLGMLPDLEVWNPEMKDFETMPAAEKPVVAVEEPPFASGKWTHVVITFDRVNSGRPDGEARLFLDGQPAGTVSNRDLRYSWDPENAVIFLGLGYAGLMDDLMIFDRALSREEVGRLTDLARDGKPLLAR